METKIENAMVSYPSGASREIIARLSALEQRLAKLGLDIQTLAALIAKLTSSKGEQTCQIPKRFNG